MKIGILTFSSAINFGANLQACSTYCYLKNQGYDPVFINYVPYDSLNEDKGFPSDQVAVLREFQHKFDYTELCHDSKEVAEVLEKNDIRNVIVGSDAVAQHHPFLSRIVFPSRHVVSISKVASDKLFPNPFWGEFLDYVKHPVNVCLMSVSNQQSKFRSFSTTERQKMMRYLSQFKYISVRDDWTQKMYRYISNGTIQAEVTPDPVFAFNYNVPFIPDKEEIRSKFNLPEKYILLALHRGKSVSASWVEQFETICEQYGYNCLGLPFPYGYSSTNNIKSKLPVPLSPIDWYALIKYADGYVGFNMHTIVSALHNAVPCFSMDQYGRRFLSQFVYKKTSKIYHILNAAGFPEYRSPAKTIIDLTPEPGRVFKMLMDFNKKKCKMFAQDYYNRYLKMMECITTSFTA